MRNQTQIDHWQSVMNQMKFDGPFIRKIIEQQTSDRRVQQKEFAKEVIRRLRIQNKKLLQRVELLKEKIRDNKSDKKQVMKRLNYLVKLNANLAQALGSCSSCWGEDPGCAICSGEGYPGWQKVNKRLFNLYVLPAIEKINGGRGG